MWYICFGLVNNCCSNCSTASQNCCCNSCSNCFGRCSSRVVPTSNGCGYTPCAQTSNNSGCGYNSCAQTTNNSGCNSCAQTTNNSSCCFGGCRRRSCCNFYTTSNLSASEYYARQYGL
ncbi:MAG: hypothetical protein IJV80_03105 [Clostridia bacterium]|nr:hypothetical protein [Clostridia bacterium]